MMQTKRDLRRANLLCLACSAAMILPAYASESTLYTFPGPAGGSGPEATVIRTSGGATYGMTPSGGPANSGVVYEVSPAGKMKTLYAFKGGADGRYPFAGLVRDSAGNLYGVTVNGGVSNAGVVFKLDTSGNETVLHSFTGGDGAQPLCTLVMDAAGNIYGTAENAGLHGVGVVFKLDPAGNETTLYAFNGGTDGANPFGGVILDSSGNLYGTTQSGGLSNQGTVFKIDTSNHEMVLYSFQGGSDGANPQASLLRDSSGNLYGTTTNGGASNLGTVFKIDPSGNETIIHTFTGSLDGGSNGVAMGSVVRDAAGNLYGATPYGGTYDFGAIYKIDTANNKTVLFSFTGKTDGGVPYCGVTMDASGNLYGTAYQGGTTGNGVVYKLSAAGAQTILANFMSPPHGEYLEGAIIRTAGGTIYGATASGGLSGMGTVFKLSSTGTQTVLHSFAGGSDGAFPAASVLRDSSGNLYGTTQGGGANNFGVVYKITAAGAETILHTFAGGADGANPLGAVIRDSAGNLYGTTAQGGTANLGTVYKIDSSGNETVLYSFMGGTDGAIPTTALVRDSAGNLYGTTVEGGASNQGIVFKLSKTNHLTMVYQFTGAADGSMPASTLLRDSAGNLYGTTAGAGSGSGVVYKVDPAGTETVLYTFTGGSDGGNGDFSFVVPGLTRDSSGNLYGATTSGGSSGFAGVVFKLDPTGTQTVLYSFSGSDGCNPTGVVRDTSGNLYGAAGGCGATNEGNIFEITP